eukprot:6986069-Prymnesium_polylepis.1
MSRCRRRGRRRSSSTTTATTAPTATAPTATAPTATAPTATAPTASGWLSTRARARAHSIPPRRRAQAGVLPLHAGDRPGRYQDGGGMHQA